MCKHGDVTFYWCAVCKSWQMTHSTNRNPVDKVPKHTNFTKTHANIGAAPRRQLEGNLAVDPNEYDWQCWQTHIVPCTSNSKSNPNENFLPTSTRPIGPKPNKQNQVRLKRNSKPKQGQGAKQQDSQKQSSKPTDKMSFWNKFYLVLLPGIFHSSLEIGQLIHSVLLLLSLLPPLVWTAILWFLVVLGIWIFHAADLREGNPWWHYNKFPNKSDSKKPFVYTIDHPKWKRSKFKTALHPYIGSPKNGTSNRQSTRSFLFGRFFNLFASDVSPSPLQPRKQKPSKRPKASQRVKSTRVVANLHPPTSTKWSIGTSGWIDTNSPYYRAPGMPNEFSAYNADEFPPNRVDALRHFTRDSLFHFVWDCGCSRTMTNDPRDFVDGITSVPPGTHVQCRVLVMSMPPVRVSWSG